MTTREVVLDGGSPWGFRMHGGVDFQHPLRISRVNPGSKASLKGIREGDIITSINNQSTKDITNADAQVLLKKSGDTLKLGLNEDCNGSPKRRQYNKIVQQETHSEKIERTTSKLRYTTSTTSSINHNPFEQHNDPQKSHVNGLSETNGVSENGVLSQRSTLSSNCSSNSSAGSLSAEPQGIELRREAAPRRFNLISGNSTKLLVTKPVSTDNPVNIIIENNMGGNSRSHKKRSRLNRKKGKNLPNLVEVVPLEMPSSSSPRNSDVIENDALISETATKPSEVENDEVTKICAANKLLDNVQSYRVESPKDPAVGKTGVGIVKSRSLDNDEVKITELSSEASDGEAECVNECTAVVSETESDVEWEVTEDLNANTAESNFNLGKSTLESENKLETVHITLITAEEERNLREFLGGLNLATSNEEPISLEQRRETYKERKARKRAAIAEHFIPILQQPRYLDVINEESNDSSDKDHDSNASSRANVNKMGHQEKDNVEANWTTFIASGAELVFIDSSSEDESTVEENDDDADAEESKSESVCSSNQDLAASCNQEASTGLQDAQTSFSPDIQSTLRADSNLSLKQGSKLRFQQDFSPSLSRDSNLGFQRDQNASFSQDSNHSFSQDSNPSFSQDSNPSFAQDLNRRFKKDLNLKFGEEPAARFKEDSNKHIIPSSQLTPPPTPDLPPTPKNELIGPDFDKEFKDFCADLSFPGCKYLNAVSPLESRASSVSSEGSSKTQSQRTARLNSMCSSIADVADLLKDEENGKDANKLFEPESLREICLKGIMLLPFGRDILQELAEVSKYIDNLTAPFEAKISPSLSELTREFSQKNPNANFDVTANWAGLPVERDKKVLVCSSPTQKCYLESTPGKGFDEAGKLLELHEKFMNSRGGCNEESERDLKGVEITTALSSDVGDNNSSKAAEFSNRLLAIIRESSDAQPISYLNVNNDNMIRARESRLSKSLENLKLTLINNMNTLDINKRNLSEWRENDRRQISDTEGTKNYPSVAEANESTRVQSSVGNRTSFTNIPNRRFSLPQEFYQRQMHYIREKEKEIQTEIEKLEKEKRSVMAEMEAEIHPRQFEADKYRISKNGDIAIHNDEVKSQKIEQSQTLPEYFRQRMYDEYMLQVQAREERKLQKVIKITSSPLMQTPNNSTFNLCDVTHASDIEDEFMEKVKKRMQKFGLTRDPSEDARKPSPSDAASEEPILVIDGELLKEAKELPKHLQEFVVITRHVISSTEDANVEGVWSPGQKSSDENSSKDRPKSSPSKQEDAPIPPVWTPRSAGSSPTLERKEFRPVNFESPTLERRNKSKPEVSNSSSPSGSVNLPSPWQGKENGTRVGAQDTSLDRRLPTSHSAPASGFTEFSTPRLPRAQNPTITLLQKAREGQLPRGAHYLQNDHPAQHRSPTEKPPHLSPAEVLYHRRDYTSDSDTERPRRMAEMVARKYESGIGPTTKDGMPLVLRSEVKDGNQSRWYKRMYETIHKQKPDRDYVTVRYKQRRARYPYLSGYFSEPENSAFTADYYDSDGTLSDSKYATLDRRRLLQPQATRDKENDYVSATMPRETTKSILIKREPELPKKPPGRIENYTPGNSSISEKEAKEWWDEVMDIFDGWLDDHSALPSYNILLSRAISKSHLEQQKNVPQQPRGYMSKALKESGYESDSTLLFKRREEAIQQLSSLEQREAYKTIQKGGDVPLHGLRKLVPERPREEYRTKSPTSNRYKTHIRPQNEIICYPLSVPPHPAHLFADYKRAVSPSFTVRAPAPVAPSPPKRRSSRNSSTLKLISTIKGRAEKSPASKRHETCFASYPAPDKNKVSFLKEKLTKKLSTSKKKPELEVRARSAKVASVAPMVKPTCKTSSMSDLSSAKSASLRSLSASPSRRVVPPKASVAKVKPGTFGSEKRKVDLVLPKVPRGRVSKSVELLSPTEVKKAVISQINSLGAGTTYKNSRALYSSAKNGKAARDKSLEIQVGYSSRGKELLKPSRVSTSLPGTPMLSRSTRLQSSPSPSEKSRTSSQKSLDSLASRSSSRAKPKVKDSEAECKKLRKSRKDQLNGEIAKRVKKANAKPAELKVKSKQVPLNKTNVKTRPCQLTQDMIKKQKELVQTNSFFTHLFWDDIPPPPVLRTAWAEERLQSRKVSSISEPSIGALKIYLNHTKPVTDSKFRSLDAAIMRARSASPKAVRWKSASNREEDKARSVSLPPKIVLSQTSRPVSPVVRASARSSTKLVYAVAPTVQTRASSNPSKIIFSETSRPVSPVIRSRHKVKPSESLECIPRLNAKMYFSETSRPVSPVIGRRPPLSVYVDPRSERSCNSSLENVAENTYSTSPLLEKRRIYVSNELIPPVFHRKVAHLIERQRSPSPSTKLYFSETNRPVSPLIQRRQIERERSESPAQKLYFSETTRPVSPLIERKYKKDEKGHEYEYERSYSPSQKIYFSETTRPLSPFLEKPYNSEHLDKPSSPIICRSPSSRKISQVKASRYPNELIQKISRSKSADAVKELSNDDDSLLSLDVDLIPQKEHKSFWCDRIHSPQRCSKFKELNHFYSTLERMNELERTTSSSELRPRRKNEEEIIDFDRWKEVHTRERAEKELESLYDKLKIVEQEKGFLFQPKDVKKLRWNQDLERGLRIRDKSVDKLKESFEKLKDGDAPQVGRVKSEVMYDRELYKPLWRGSSVVDLATSMVEKRSHSEGRVSSLRKKLLESERLLTHGIGSRIWSSLSSEQINLLKGQLAEIYSQNGPKKDVSNSREIIVPANSIRSCKPSLSVRRNSDEMVKVRPIMSEVEKKRLSQSLSREVLHRVRQQPSSNSLVIGKEVLGAVAAASAKVNAEIASPRTCYSLELSEDERDKKQKGADFVLVLAKNDSDDHKNTINKTMQNWAEREPKKALVTTDATAKRLSMSETESGSTDESTKTVIYLNKKDRVLKKVEYFEHVAEEQPYTPIIYRAAENHSCDGEIELNAVDSNSLQSEDLNQPRKLTSSQSYQDFKELFGEQEQSKFSTAGLFATSAVNEQDSAMKAGEVEELKNKFENLEDFYSHRLVFRPRRCRSNPELCRKQQIVIPGQAVGEVDNLRRKYEYPWIFGRGRSRIRRGGVVSPVYFRTEDRYMPHINIISKIASLYPKKTVFLSDVRKKSARELARILGCPLGEVERLRSKFESPERDVSLLGHMFTSSPNLTELRDISPYLTASWAAHKYPRVEDNTRSLSSPEHSPASWNTDLVKRRPRPKSTSPPRSKIKLSPILKHRHVTQNGLAKEMQRSCPSFEPVRYKSTWSQTTRPTVTFKETEAPTPPPKGHHGLEFFGTESPRKYVEKEVTIHYKSPIRQEVKESLSEEELARRQAEHMKRVYEEERRRKYLQVSVSDSINELQDMNNRRHTDNFIPSQKSPIPLNRYDDFPVDEIPKIKSKSPDFRLVARALYNFVGQSSRELTFRKGDVIYIRRQVDKNWYEGEQNAMVGLFPANYVEIIPYDGVKSTPRKPHEGHARAKFNFIAQTHLELSLAKGELVVVTRRVDDNWFEGRIGGRKGIFPVSYVEVLIDPSTPPPPSAVNKPVASPAAHSILINGSAGGKESMGSHSYTPIIPQQQQNSSYRAKPVQISQNYGSLTKSLGNSRNPLNEVLHIDTHSESIPYRALYKYRPQNDDELELMEGDVVFVLEKCDDGWYVGSSQRTGAFGTFPGNYVERI